MAALFALPGEAWRWWLREFLSLLPAAGRAYARLPLQRYLPQRRSLLLKVRPSETELAAIKGDLIEWTARIGHPPSGNEAAELRAALDAQYRGFSGPATVLLPRESVLETTLRLPRAAAQHLAETASYQIERLSPFPPANTLYALGAVTGDAAGEEIEAQIFVAAKDLVEEAGERAEALGFPVAAFAVETPAPRNFERLAFAGQQASSGGLPFRVRVLLAAVALLAVSLGAAPIVSKTLALASVEDEIVRLKPGAEQAAKLRSTREKQHGVLNKAVELRRAAHLPLEVLTKLTAALDDASFLAELRLEGTALTISGLSSDASALAQKLASVPGFKAVKFSGPVTHDARTARDRFTLVIELANPS